MAVRKVASAYLASIEREHSFLIAMTRANVRDMMWLDIQDVHADTNSVECRYCRHCRGREG